MAAPTTQKVPPVQTGHCDPRQARSILQQEAAAAYEPARACFVTIDRNGGCLEDNLKKQEFLRRLNQIEDAVNTMSVPASFADQFYGLRGHISFVRNRLQDSMPAA